MRILFLSENYFPNVSGVPVVVKYLAEGLTRRGHNVTIATTSFKDEPFIDNISGVDVYRFKMRRNKMHFNVGEKSKYVNFVRSFNADVLIVECSQCITTDIILPHLIHISGKKIFHSHGFSGLELKPFAVKDNIFHSIGNTWNWLASQLYFKYTLKYKIKYFNASMCLSELDSSKQYLEMNVAQNYILDNAADDIFFSTNIIHDAIKKYVILENEKYIMSCANYTVVKNQKDMIIQYFKSNSSKFVSLVCIGSFPTEYYNECMKLVEQLKDKYGHRDVKLIYGVKRSDLPSIMNEASLYLVSSHYEQYSISIIEAMSQGVPFISTNTGNASILPGGVTIENIEKMNLKIDSLLLDDSLRNRYSQAGKEYAYANCRIEAVIDKLEEIIYSN